MSYLISTEEKPSTTEARNVYGMQMARAFLWKAALQNMQHTSRFLYPFCFRRRATLCGSMGGDNQAKTSTCFGPVIKSPQMSFVGYSICRARSRRLYRRWKQKSFTNAGWKQVSSLLLFVITAKYAAANEPWAYGEEAEGISKTYIELRYRLMPHLRKVLCEASQQACPSQEVYASITRLMKRSMTIFSSTSFCLVMPCWLFPLPARKE